tara:strand:+ start:272 stop:421 length:150 start_codon:yes stop_codon:yes gene_type:complete
MTEMDELLLLSKNQLATMLLESNEIIDSLALKFGMDFIMQIYFHGSEEE